MNIPDFQAVMLPLLRALEDGETRTMREVTRHVSDVFRLTEEERAEMLPSGQQTIISNRIAWAKTHMKMAGLIENPVRGQVRLSDLGRKILAEKPSAIGIKTLRRFPSYLAFTGKAQPDGEVAVEEAITEVRETPHVLIDVSYRALRQATTEDLVSRLKASSPAFFEKVVVQLLVAMGYGGVEGHGTVTGKSGDGGIDGVIQQDKLGLEIVCIQAKRWEGPVGRPVVQGFVGSMDYVKAKKGVIMSTSAFTREAQDFVHRIEAKRVVLIDGDRLADLMIEHNLGVTTTKVYELKEVSNDFFDESEA